MKRIENTAASGERPDANEAHRIAQKAYDDAKALFKDNNFPEDIEEQWKR